ncbi:HepT-like ribonuclease domain-containing protein [Methylotetracoccus oryzae]|uniref:HepT-like ribonuclease domain-containing protein n=1 Tax=Methylotetracoccus oryzae TaxID=1919059 RepID=UPI001118DF55|nr:HepT-like ribonuclease domain-containing protein [Methylotetracoccus oryzae]
MPMNDEDPAYLWDMLEAARDAVEILAGRDKAAWNQDRVIRLAVERSVEIVGEAARHVSQATRAAYPEIPWRQIVGLRNILAHEYGHIDHARLFETVIRDLPELIERLRAIIPAEPDG